MSANHLDPSKPIVVSTGPRTEEGRAISSRNAMKHGCCSTDTLILQTESIDDFKALEADWFRAYSPKDGAETLLVQKLVTAEWFLQRATRVLAEVESQIFEAVPYGLHWDDCHHRVIARFMRYERARANAADKCRKAIEDYRRNRNSETAQAGKSVIARERHQVYMDKHKPGAYSEQLLQALIDSPAEREFRERHRHPGKL